MSKTTRDISVDTLEEIVKTHGDGVVVGYVRFKKVKECMGYKDARNKAAVRLSKVKGGRLVDGNEYAAVIRFRWIFLLLFIGLLLFFFWLWKMKPKAQIREEVTTGEYETIIESEPETSEFIPETMDIPGYSDLLVSDREPAIILYNPVSNKCQLGYRIISGNICIYESEKLQPGETANANIYRNLTKGVYRVKIITTGYGMDGSELNSVCQTVILKVE